jgi:hypothetical protein
MKMKKIILLFLCTVLFACSEKPAEKIPDSILPKEKMAEVLVDVHLLEASLNLSASPAIIASSGKTEVNADVLTKNNITRSQYDESFMYYTQNPKQLSEIYQLVLNSLSKMQAEVTTKK